MVKALNMELFSDPAYVQKATKEELIDFHEVTKHILEDLEATTKAVRDELMARMTTNGEVIGDYAITKVKKALFKTTLEQATELGAVKPAVDNTILKGLVDKGIEVPGYSFIEYLLIKEINREKTE